LVDAGTIRVIDALILTKNEDGTIDAAELADVAELGELKAVEAEMAELLAADDVEYLAAAMEPGSTAGVLIWENLWAAPFAAAARRGSSSRRTRRRSVVPVRHSESRISSGENTNAIVRGGAV
jgi:hypothetical protein